MKTLIAPILATASFATILVCGLAVAASMNAPYQPHHFQHIDASMWSDTPTKVDQGTQNYERLAALSPAPLASQSFAMHDPVDDQPVAAEQQPTAQNATAADVSSCQQRYRSYRVADNTYQPLTGGARQQCEIGENDVAADATASTAASEKIADNSTADHGAWCSTRYSSYNSADDTYQPYGGGARRACVSPVGLVSNG